MDKMNLRAQMLERIEDELKEHISRLDQPATHEFHEILTYHMGWTGELSGKVATGKRIRPMLVLLTTVACEGDWQFALPASAAVELVHNFSLVHDDIQDNSPLRRGRPTVWKNWGIAQGINAGDALFILAGQAILALQPKFTPDVISKCMSILNASCLNLTRGQYLDISYESIANMPMESYWPMISGKTASLISCCCELGSILGNSPESTHDAYRSFGHYLGLAFQVRDDLLGIWGDSAQTGKSVHSDLVEGKKTLPVLFGLGIQGSFSRRWLEAPIRPDEVASLSELLEREGARLFTQEKADQMTDLAIQSLQQAAPVGEAGQMLFDLAYELLGREI